MRVTKDSLHRESSSRNRGVPGSLVHVTPLFETMLPAGVFRRVPPALSICLLLLSAQSGCVLEFPEPTQCGDGIVTTGEECDGNSLPVTSCADIGLGSGPLSCAPDCTFDTSDCSDRPKCGNGIKEYGETCDGTDLGDTRCENLGLDVGILSCTDDCRYDTSLCVGIRCGNGLVEEREDCDDGNEMDDDGCSSTCGIETGWRCDGAPSSCSPICGDGLVVGDEDCDVDSAGGSCQDWNAGYGEVTCSPGCRWDTSQCVAATDISGGNSHTCAALSDGAAWCWGNNYARQLGDGTATTRSAPVQVQGLTNVLSVASGSEHSCAVTEDGTAWCWGTNNVGQLGDGTTTSSATPVQVQGLSNVSAISASYVHNCALTEDNTAWCWGGNDFGQLGDGTTTSSATPVQVLGLPGSVISISVGDSYSCALTEVQTVWCWGKNDHGQLGDGTMDTRMTPVQVLGITNVTSLAAGYQHSCAVDFTGNAWCWGKNSVGQLGNGTHTSSATPVQVTSLPARALSISVSGNHSCALLENGTAWCWGWNDHGQLGNGTLDDGNVPTKVLLLTEITAISLGTVHSCAITANGLAWCWGWNERGQLGDGSRTDSSIPVQVSF